MLKYLYDLIFPSKCIFCRKVLSKDETDLCHHCRENAPEFQKSKNKHSFIARWTAVWYYKDNVRNSLLRYKFGRRRSYAACYGRQLAMKLQNTDFHQPDVLVWVPISRRRRMVRGFDQVALLAAIVAKELGIPALPVLKKIRHTPPQSSLRAAAERRANILGAYRVVQPETVRDQQVLLLDDIITTGATVSECARMLTMAGAVRITCAAIAAAPHDRKNRK